MNKAKLTLDPCTCPKCRKAKQPNYEKAFNILYEYFDSIADEEKPKVNKKLKRCGV